MVPISIIEFVRHMAMVKNSFAGPLPINLGIGFPC
jgi:hypothetical protein